MSIAPVKFHVPGRTPNVPDPELSSLRVTSADVIGVPGTPILAVREGPVPAFATASENS